MAEIETLTDAEREELNWPMSHRAQPKALRIIDSQAARISQLESQLPASMQTCTIRFLECRVGHGRLTATNWIHHGCPHCRIAELERFAARVVIESFDAQDCLPPEQTPATVADLVQKYRGYAVGECHDCGRRAPLKAKPDRPFIFREFVCAWGCAEPDKSVPE